MTIYTKQIEQLKNKLEVCRDASRQDMTNLALFKEFTETEAKLDTLKKAEQLHLKWKDEFVRKIKDELNEDTVMESFYKDIVIEILDKLSKEEVKE